MRRLNKFASLHSNGLFCCHQYKLQLLFLTVFAASGQSAAGASSLKKLSAARALIALIKTDRPLRSMTAFIYPASETLCRDYI